MLPRGPVRIARLYWQILTIGQRRSAVVLLFLMLLGTMLEMVGIGLIIPLLALLAEPDIASRYPAIEPFLAKLGYPSHSRLIAGAMLAFVSVFALKAVFLAFAAARQMRFVYNVQASVSQKLFDGYLRQPWPFHLRRNSAQLVRNSLSETAIFAASGLMPGLILISESFVVIGVVLLLVMVEAVGAAVVGSGLSLAMWVFHRTTRRRTLEWGRARQLHEGLRLKYLHEGLGGAKEIKLLGREAEFLEMYRTHNQESARYHRRQSTLLHMPRLLFEVLAITGLAILVLAMLLRQKPLETVVPILALFAAAAFRLMPSMNRIANAIQGVRFAVPAVETLSADLRLIESQPVLRHGAVISLNHCLKLRSVSFAYEGSAEPALEAVDLVLRRGETVGLIGGSGAGKTTLVDIIVGLLPPEQGTVLVDGVDIHANLRAWRDLIGYVPQTVYLTDDTLRRNVAYGVAEDNIDDNAVNRALVAAQLAEFVAGLPDGAETIVGERGVRLSGGQRQRIGIARALYHNPAVLVLDEATSSLDGDTEEGVMQAIRALHGEKTILIVAHRISTVTDCDRLYRLEYGRIVDSGRTSEVLARFADRAEREVATSGAQ